MSARDQDGARGPGHNALTIALAPLASHLAWQRLVEGLRLGVLLALAGVIILALAGRLLAETAWPEFALAWSAAILLVAIIAPLLRRPDTLGVARAADHLGLAERVASAIHADQVGAAVAPLLLRDAVSALERLDPRSYRPLVEPRRWRLAAALVVILAVAILAPLPPLGDPEGHRQAMNTVAVSRSEVEGLRRNLLTALPSNPLADRAVAELQTLEADLARAEGPAAADRAMEAAQERLTGLPDTTTYAWRRAIADLASTWSTRPELAGIARALATRDPAALDAAMEQLAGRMSDMAPDDRHSVQLALQAGANTARDVPGLASALRETASRVAAPGEASEAMSELGATLREGAAQAASLGTVQGATAGLGQARARLAQAQATTAGVASSGANPGKSGSASASAAGSSSTTGGAARSGAAGQTASGAGSASGTGAGGANGAGAGTSSGSGAGASSNSQGAGAGSSGNSAGNVAGTSGAGSSGNSASGGAGTSGANSSGNSAGSGAAGTGTGGGAGAGGSAAPGQAGMGNASAAGAGGNANPSTSGATTYDPVFAPSLLGGPDGPQVELRGDLNDAGGATVELPNSPLDAGAIRPYDTVYGDYEAAARRSAARQSLPSGLQTLVQRYFSAIAPDRQSSTEQQGR